MAENFLEIKTIEDLLAKDELQNALLYVCVFGENARMNGQRVPPKDASGKKIKELLDRVYGILCEKGMFEEYVLVYESTRYVPHGSLIQPIFDKVFEYYGNRIKSDKGLSDAEKQILWKYIFLSLEAYDKLHTFRIFLAEFREYMPLGLLPKAMAIATRLGDKQFLSQINMSLLRPHREVDQSEDGDG